MAFYWTAATALVTLDQIEKSAEHINFEKESWDISYGVVVNFDDAPFDTFEFKLGLYLYLRLAIPMRRFFRIIIGFIEKSHMIANFIVWPFYYYCYL